MAVKTATILEPAPIGGAGEGVLPIRPIREGFARKGYLFGAQVYERVGISLVEVYERVGKSVFSVDKITPAGLTGTFYGCIRFMAGFLIYSYTVEPRPLSGHPPLSGQ